MALACTSFCVPLPGLLKQAGLHYGEQVIGGRYAEAAAKHSYDAQKKQAVS